MMNIEKVFAVTRRRWIGAFTQYALVPEARAALQKAGGAVESTACSSSGWLKSAQKRAGILTAVLACTLTMLTGCRGVSENEQASYEISPQQLFMFSPLTDPAPATGVAVLRVNLGRRLYYDRHLSENASISCNSCHDLANYGVDPGKAVSTGHNKLPGGRNSPTVYNAGLQFVQFWDGRAATLAAQASGPMMNPVEMGMSGPDAVLAYIHSNPAYMRQFKEAYPALKDPVVMDNVTDAIAAFEDGLLTPARWDKYLAGNVNALSNEEKKGLRVYLDAGCAACHAGKGLGGNSYQKLGVYRDWPDQQKDPGRFTLTSEARDRMYFKVPLLRNVDRTGPWFHDGHVQTIQEAVRLMGEYQTGRKLSDADVNLIVSFLHSLTGDIPQQYIQAPSDTASAPETGDRHGRWHKIHHAMQSSAQEGE
jgi:cytochrome c peroxidase